MPDQPPAGADLEPLDLASLREQGQTWFHNSGAASKRDEVADKSLRFCLAGYKVDFDEYLKSALSPHFDTVLREQHRTIRMDVDEGRSDPDNFNPEGLAHLIWFVQRQRSAAAAAWSRFSSKRSRGTLSPPRPPGKSTRDRKEPEEVPAMTVLKDHRTQISRILQAYLQRNRFPGYVQGMNYLACWLACFMNEEKAFWVLCRVIEDIRPRDFYSREVSPMHGFKCECKVLAALIRTRIPEFTQYLLPDPEELEVLVQMFASKTLIPVFVNQMQPSTLMVVWEMFLSGKEEFGRRSATPEPSPAAILGLALDFEDDVPRKELGGEASLLRVCLAIFGRTVELCYPVLLEKRRRNSETPDDQSNAAPVHPVETLELYLQLMEVCQGLTAMDLTEALRSDYANISNEDIRTALQVVRDHQAWKWVGSAAAGNMIPVEAVTKTSPEEEALEKVASAESAFQSLNRLMESCFGGEIQLRWFARRFVRLFTGTPRITRTTYREAIQHRLIRLRGKPARARDAPSPRSAGEEFSPLAGGVGGPPAPPAKETASSQHMRNLRRLLNQDLQQSSDLEDLLPGLGSDGRGGVQDIPSIGMNRLQFHHFLHNLHNRAKIGIWYRWDEYGRIFEIFDEDDTGLIDFKQLLLYLRVVLFGSLDDRLRLLFDIYDRHSLSCLTADALADMEETLLETVGDMHSTAEWARELAAETEEKFDQSREYRDAPRPSPTEIRELLEEDHGTHPGRRERILSAAFDGLNLEQAVHSVQRLFQSLRQRDAELLDFCTFRTAVVGDLVFRCALSCGPVQLRPAYEPIPVQPSLSSPSQPPQPFPISQRGPVRAPRAAAEDGKVFIPLLQDAELEGKQDPARWGRRRIDLNQPELYQLDVYSMLEAAVDVVAFTLPLGPCIGGGEIQFQIPPFGGSSPREPVQRDPRQLIGLDPSPISSDEEEDGLGFGFLDDVCAARESPGSPALARNSPGVAGLSPRPPSPRPPRVEQRSSNDEKGADSKCIIS